MYLLVTHIPIHVTGGRLFLDSGWFPDVLLARDWLARPFGELTLLAPWIPLDGEQSEYVEITPSTGIRAVPVIDWRCRARTFWTRERAHWITAVRRELAGASVLHTGMDDLYRPVEQLAFLEAHRAGVPTVLVGPDMDPHEVWSGALGQGPLRSRVEKRLYLVAHDWALARMLRRADLALLKEGAVHDRYARFAANPKAFCHTMYGVRDVIGEAALEHRLAGLSAGGKLRLVSCGRLVRRKGLLVALDIVERLLRRGLGVELDIIGSGPEEAALRSRIDERRLSSAVRLCGSMAYGPALLQRLGGYDAMLYSPLEEDTPRVLYDGYAAGLPFVGSAIPFARHRVATDGAGVLFPVNDAEEGARMLAGLEADRARLAALSRRARAAGLAHAVEGWYGRRSAWTVEAVERRRAGSLIATRAN